MKSTGIVRKVDNLGRVVIPKELRRVLEIGDRDSLEIFVNGSQIVLQKYAFNCIICGSEDNTQRFNGKLLCTKCIKQLSIVYSSELIAN